MVLQGGSSDWLEGAVIRAGLSGRTLVNTLSVFANINSTNRYLLEQGGHGDVCVAEQQTEGRGRRGRAWQSPVGQNIYLSMRWHFNLMPTHYAWLSLMTAVAVCEVLQANGLKAVQIKWPNDIYFQQQKLGGILLQTSQSLEHVVIGIGLNVNMEATEAQTEYIDQPWTSLKRITETDWDRNYLIAQLLNALSVHLNAFSDLDVDRMQYLWQPWDMLQQRSVTVQDGNSRLLGHACGLDRHGHLLVLDQQGSLKSFAAADVSVRM